MKTLKLLSAALLLTTAPFALQAADTYKLDPSHTEIVWQIDHFGFSKPTGKFHEAEGLLVLDEANPEKSTLSVDIDINKLTTGVAALDEHLKKPDFFDVAKFPKAHFQSERIERVGTDGAKVYGNLTLHGVTKPVTLDVKLNKKGENMMKKQTVGFSATTTLKRSDFGMNLYTPGLGDDVPLAIQSEANKVDLPAQPAK